MDGYREDRRRQLIQEQQKAQIEAAQAASKERELGEQVAALEARPDAPAYACPACWYERGQHIEFTPVPSEDEIDRFRCRQCGFEDSQAA